jgi:hypothetical protein
MRLDAIPDLEVTAKEVMQCELGIDEAARGPCIVRKVLQARF